MIKKVLDVKIDDISTKEALDKVADWLQKKSVGKVIVTPGPEFILTSQKDEEFKKILNSADLSLPDGFGLQLFAGIKNRVPGRKFMLRLCELAADNNWSIGLVGGFAGDGKKVAEKLKTLFPKIKISSIVDGEDATKIKNGYDIDNYIKQPIDMLFLAFGHPAQEKLLNKFKMNNVQFKIGVGIGGVLDYLAGRYPESPKFLQSMGLEWLWRLVTQPWRIGRIFKAVIVFPIMLFLDYGKVRS